MSRLGAPTNFVGNDFVLPKAKIQIQRPVVAPRPPIRLNIPVTASPSAAQIEVVVNHHANSWHKPFQSFLDYLHKYSLGAFALMFLIVGSSGIQVAASYRSSQIENSYKQASLPTLKAPAIAGLNKSVASSELDQEIQKIIQQSATIKIGDQVITIKPETIKSWLKITPSADNTTAIQVRSKTIAASLNALANKYVITPVDQVTVVHEDGIPTIVVQGKTGTRLTDPETLDAQASQIAKTLMDSKGIAFNTPMESVPFQAITPAAFDKLIEVNVNTKQLYAYEKGQIVNTLPISAGAPATPTPIGQFKIFSKLSVQDMKGFNPNGTKYFQPNVRWINYFLPGGFAIHGNYWRPASWFGNINSSHGCVSLPDQQAKWIYDFAPIGTTVITHN